MKRKKYFFILFALAFQSLVILTQPDVSAQCDIWVVAETPNNDINIQLVLNELNNKGIIPVRAGNISQLRDNVIQTLQDNGCCLRNLYIVGHGAPGVLSLNGRSVSPTETISGDNEAQWGDPLFEISVIKGCSGDRSIYLFGCNIGARCDGSNLLYKLAKKFGATIKAPIDRVVEEDIYSNKLTDYINYGRWQQASNSMSSPPLCIDSLNQKQLRERKKAIEQLWYCPCNGQVYQTNQDCAASCPSGLGCFTDYTCEYAYKNNTFDRNIYEPVLGIDYWVSQNQRSKKIERNYDQHKKYHVHSPAMLKYNPSKNAESWSILGVSQPCVIKENDGYRMWFMGWDEYDVWRIGYAFSYYGIDWDENPGNPVLTESVAGNWDDGDVYSPCVIKDGDIYKMWYTGWSDTYKKARIGYATSPDGIAWTKQNAPVLSEGSTGTWDSEGVGAPAVIKDGTTYKMWYEGSDAGQWWRIGYATSPDGINWTKHSNNPVLSEGNEGNWDEWGLGAPSVVKDNNSFHMWFSGIDSYNIARIGYAVSQNGYKWTKSNENPVIDRGYGESWCNVDIGHPAVVKNTNEHILELWYRGLNDQSNYGIGYAAANTSSFTVGIKDLYHQKQFPENSILFQNYPNPFNPTTNFEFEIANPGLVTLKMYDVLGKEVATIVNEELHAGKYNYQWKATGFASGVYFYQLKAGDFFETKKLILMK